MDKASIMNRIGGIVVFFALLCGFFTSCQWLPEVGKVSLSESSVALKVGGSRTLTATVEPAAAEYEGIIWHTSDPSVVVVSNGRIVAEKVGSATITASAAGVTSSPCQVTVSKTPVSNVSLDKSSVSILEGESLSLKVTVSPSDATDGSVTWSTGNSKVATVSSTGTITAVEEGETTITAKSDDSGITAACRVVVTAEYVDFPDPNFRKYMVDNFDLNGNGKISLKEAKKVTRIQVFTTEIESLDGLQFLTELSYLDVHNPYGAHGSFDSETGLWIHTLYDDMLPGKLSSLDLSQNLKLTYLSCSNNQLTELNVGNNIELKELYCRNNKIRSLDLRRNKNIEKLFCSDNKLSHLEIAGLLKLSWLSCSNNPLGTIDLSTLVNLRGVNCDANLLSNINLSQNTSLEYLQCDHNRIDNIDLSSNTLLETLDCSSNQLTSLDVSKNTALARLICDSNQLMSLDVSKNTALTDLSCYSNQLTTLDVSKNKSLTNLDCSPMSTLKTLYVSSGQSIEGVTVNRSTDRVPSGTSIKTK